MYWMVAIGLGLLAWGCKEKEAVDPPPPPQTPNKNKSFQKPEGKNYTVIVDQAFHDFYHDDKNNDKIFQASSEKLFLEEGDRYLSYGGEDFEKKRKLANLPDFNGVHLAKWQGVHSALYPSGASKIHESRFTRIHEFCQKQGVDFQRAWDLGKKMNPNQDIEKLDALLVAGFLLSVQQGGEGSFYQSENLKGEKENKEFIDTVVQKIEAGKLKIKNIREKAIMEFGIGAGNFQNYNTTENSLRVAQDIDVQDWQGQSGIIHEIYHFYQDIQAKPLLLTLTEEAAYHKQVDFELRVKPLKDIDSPEALEKLIVQKTIKHPPDQELPLYHALRHHFHKKTKNSKKADEALKNLQNSIAFYYYLRPLLFIEGINPEKRIYEELNDLIFETHLKTGKDTSDPELIEEIKVRLSEEIKKGEKIQKEAKEELQKYLKKTPREKISKIEFEIRIADYIQAVTSTRHLKDILKETYPNSPFVRREKIVDFHFPSFVDPEIKEMFKENPIPYPFVWEGFEMNGVE